LGTGYEGNLRVPREVLEQLRNGVAVGTEDGR
jgi:hypothetical protein